MNWLQNIRKIFSPPTSDRNYWFYVQCDHCHEVLRGRVDMLNHLSIQYGQGRAKNTYYCRKVMIGSNRCYRQIEVEFTFDANRKLLDRQIRGGQFVTEAEYRA